ncbi:MAG: DUF2851 family protein [Bacteroidales bacterium]|nr:DUF2851 family protein [Bacteroidales bacterium]
MIPESFLQYVWLHRLFYPEGISTADGEPVEVVNPGKLNTDAGPDFFNAQVRIGDTLWAGNVEVHVEADDWFHHHHDGDSSYDNVILHVVHRSTGRPAITSKGRVVPEVVLRYPDDLFSRYDSLMSSTNTIRCARELPTLTKLDRDSWLDRLTWERFEEFNARVERIMQLTAFDLDQTFFTLLCRSLGGHVNGQPMERLALATPLKILLKHNEPLQMEALLLGQAGFLTPFIEGTETPDDYTRLLCREYDFLRSKFSLSPMDQSEWKMARLRPDNFPTIRIVQVAALVARCPGNFESVFRTLDSSRLMDCLDVAASDYWDSHYSLSHPARASRKKALGISTRRVVIINAVIPFLFAYSRRLGDQKGQLNVFNMLSFVPTEKNGKVARWTECGIEPQNEAEAQALMLLYNNYCEQRKCLLCRWGHVLLSKDFNDDNIL